MVSLTNTRTVEDTLFRVQNLILNGKNVISTDLLKDIEQHLVDYAVVCRGAERFKEMVEEYGNNGMFVLQRTRNHEGT